MDNEKRRKHKIFSCIHTLVNGRKNKIRGLKNSEGEWTFNQREIGELVNGYFKSLYRSGKDSYVRRLEYREGLSFQEIAELTRALSAPISNKEVWGALRCLKLYKALGPDGLHPGFFQKFWYYIRSSMIRFVKETFRTSQIPEGMNDTLISLIPKCPHPELISQFWPISLCDTSYKVISKVIVNWPRPFVSKIIFSLQSGFIPRRRAVDNVIILREIISSINRKQGREGFMVVNLDLEKAYERLEWDFIRQSLMFFKFPDPLISLFYTAYPQQKLVFC